MFSSIGIFNNVRLTWHFFLLLLPFHSPYLTRTTLFVRETRVAWVWFFDDECLYGFSFPSYISVSVTSLLFFPSSLVYFKWQPRVINIMNILFLCSCPQIILTSIWATWLGFECTDFFGLNANRMKTMMTKGVSCRKAANWWFLFIFSLSVYLSMIISSHWVGVSQSNRFSSLNVSNSGNLNKFT